MLSQAGRGGVVVVRQSIAGDGPRPDPRPGTVQKGVDGSGVEKGGMVVMVSKCDQLRIMEAAFCRPLAGLGREPGENGALPSLSN